MAQALSTAAVLIITCCRADYLDRTMESITSNLNGYTPTLYISQDKNEPDVNFTYCGQTPFFIACNHGKYGVVQHAR